MFAVQTAGNVNPFLPDKVNLALLIVRVVIGVTIAAHGYAKFFRGGKIPGTAGWFDSMGMKPGKLHAYMAASTEVGGGLLFAAGLLTSLAAAAIVALMVVAAWTVHRKSGFFIVAGGWEYNFILASMAIAVAAAGAGKFSLDYKLEIIKDFDGWTGLIIAIGIGVGSAIGQLAIFFHPPAEDDAPSEDDSPADDESEAVSEEADSDS